MALSKVVSSTERESGWIKGMMLPGYGAVEIRESIIGIIRACPYMTLYLVFETTPNGPSVSRIVRVGCSWSVGKIQAGKSQLAFGIGNKFAPVVIAIQHTAFAHCIFVSSSRNIASSPQRVTFCIDAKTVS